MTYVLDEKEEENKIFVKRDNKILIAQKRNEIKWYHQKFFYKHM